MNILIEKHLVLRNDSINLELTCDCDNIYRFVFYFQLIRMMSDINNSIKDRTAALLLRCDASNFSHAKYDASIRSRTHRKLIIP